MVSSTLYPAVHILGSQNVYSRAAGIADHYWPWVVFFPHYPLSPLSTISLLPFPSPSISLLLSMDTADLAFEKLRQGTTLGKNVIRIIDSETDYLADTSVVSVSGRSSSN